MRRWKRKTTCLRARRVAACGGRECRCSPARTKGGKGTVWFPCPLLTPPNPPLRRDSLRSRGKTGEMGLGSVRRANFGTLLDPEFSLRGLPRMTVRGHPVQGGGVPLRKAPLRSRVAPWSTKRICGPLAFRRATEGSRVLRKGRGVKRGRETLVSLPLLHPPPGGGNAHAMSWRISPVPGGRLSPPAVHRCIGGTAYPLLRVKKEGRSSPPAAKIKPFSPASAPQRISRSVCRSDTQHPSAQWFRRASVRRSMQ